MFHSVIGGFLLGLGTVSVAATGTVKPGETKLYGDWIAGCDNGGACQVVAFEAEPFGDNSVSLVLTRAAEDYADPVIAISGFKSKSDRYRLIVDGRVVDTGSIEKSKEEITISGSDAMKVVRELAQGRTAQLIDGAGTNLGGISLSGSSAAFRYIDAIQTRAGTRNAMIARGPKPVRNAVFSLPVISVKRVTPNDKIPDAQTLVALAEGGECVNDRFGVTEDRAYSLGMTNGAAQALTLISCGSGAYNFSSAAYIGTLDSKDKWKFKPASFDYGQEIRTENGDVPLLINADWDAGSQSFSTYVKGRGLGDCGESAHYVWNGEMFRLTQLVVMPECRGSIDWISVWRTKVLVQD